MSINRTNDFSSAPRLGLQNVKATAVEQKSSAETPTSTPATAAAPEAQKTPVSEDTQNEARTRALAGEDAIKARLFGSDLDGAQFAAATKPKPKPRPRPTGSSSMAENNAPRGPGDGPQTEFA